MTKMLSDMSDVKSQGNVPKMLVVQLQERQILEERRVQQNKRCLKAQ